MSAFLLGFALKWQFAPRYKKMDEILTTALNVIILFFMVSTMLAFGLSLTLRQMINKSSSE